MLDDATNVIERRFGQATIAVTGEKVLAVLEQRLMNVHAVTVVVDQRLGHERCRFSVCVRHIVYGVFHDLNFVGFFHEGVEFSANFTLAGRGDLVMVNLRCHAELFYSKAHGATNVMQRIYGWYRKVTTLDGWPVTGIAFLITTIGVPRALF